MLTNKILLPGHAAVDGKIEGVGEADDDIDEEDDVVDQLVVKELHEAVQKQFSQILRQPQLSNLEMFRRSQRSNVLQCNVLPIPK